MAAHAGEVADGLDEVRLALAVASDEHRGTGAEGEVDPLPAAERAELQMPDVHGQAARRMERPPSRGPRRAGEAWGEGGSSFTRASRPPAAAPPARRARRTGCA